MKAITIIVLLYALMGSCFFAAALLRAPACPTPDIDTTDGIRLSRAK